MDRVDLRLLLGVAEGLDCPVLAARLRMSETAVRRRLRRLTNPAGTSCLGRSGSEFHLTEQGQVALDSVSRATVAAEAIANLIGVDVVAMRHVRLVTSVAATGSISRAARQLGLPQPAVSAQITRIERRWGTLFHRTPRGVCAAPLLVQLLPHMQRLEKELSRLAGTSVPDDTTVAPDGLTVASEFSLTGMVDAMRDAGLANVRQHVVTIPGPNWAPAMLLADICVYADLPRSSLATPAGWDTTVSFEDPAYVLLPKNVGAGRTTIALRELAGYDWLTGPPRHPQPAVGRRGLSSGGLPTPDPLHRPQRRQWWAHPERRRSGRPHQRHPCSSWRVAHRTAGRGSPSRLDRRVAAREPRRADRPVAGAVAA